MIHDPVCPACDSRRWRATGRFRYRRQDVDRRRLSSYERLRLRVLFEVWMSNTPRVELTVVLCEECGFVTYEPRPSAADLDAKYRYLARDQRASGGAGDPAAIASDRDRARRTYEAVTRHVQGPGRVLDFGGAEGRLLVPFVNERWQGGLVDYTPEVLPGIERLGETLDDLPAGERFDAIICSHVVEHLAEPGNVLRMLSRHLAPHGVLFAEVPVDLWRGPPIRRDPVTHVNFLTARTLEQLLARNGYRVLERQAFSGSYAGVAKDVAVALATPGAGELPDPAAAVEEAERRLQPTVPMRVSRAWRGARAHARSRLSRRAAGSQ